MSGVHLSRPLFLLFSLWEMMEFYLSRLHKKQEHISRSEISSESGEKAKKAPTDFILRNGGG
uniref:Uncharacterized protein n=1 Tax=Arundo donax TaxID=35708 RepID=A0A0A9G9Y1_ARUDO